MKRFLLTLTAIFICTIAYAHTINWHVGNTILETTTCDSGESITPPTAPYKKGYHFTEWIDYRPIEYLENTGTQWIDTGVYTNGNIRWDLDTQLINTNRLCIFGSGGSTDHGLTSLRAGDTYEVYSFIRNDKRYSPGNVSIDTQRHTFVNDIYNGKVKVDRYEIDNIEPFNSSSSYRIYIGAYNNGSPNLQYGWVARYYKLKIYDNDILVRDFIPVLDPDGVPCMYDKVEQKLYYNQGTGQFIAGPVIGE